MTHLNRTLAILGLALGTALPAHAAGLATFTMVARDGRLVPAVLQVPAGVRFKIVIRNEGHDAVEFESLQLRKEKVLAPGAQSFVVIAPLKPGSYDIFDEFHPDTSRGRIVAQ
jgi:plastocyanin